MAEEPVLACPFCGGKAEESEYTDCDSLVLLASCDNCCGEWPRQAWNTRVEPTPPTEEQIEAIRSTLHILEDSYDAGACSKEIAALRSLLSQWTRK